MKRLLFAGLAILLFTSTLFLVRSQSTSAPDFPSVSSFEGLPEVTIEIPTGSTGSTGAFTATKITGRDMLSAMRAIRNKSVIASGTLTVYQEDDTAAAWTATVGSDPSANPIISIDPT